MLNNEDGKHIYLRHQNTWEFNFADYESQVHAVAKPDFFSEEDFSFYENIKPQITSKPPKHYTYDNFFLIDLSIFLAYFNLFLDLIW